MFGDMIGYMLGYFVGTSLVTCIRTIKYLFKVAIYVIQLVQYLLDGICDITSISLISLYPEAFYQIHRLRQVSENLFPGSLLLIL